MDGTPGILSGAGGRKPIKTGMKELAVMREKVNEQQRQMGKASKAHHNHEDSKKSRLSTGRVRRQGLWGANGSCRLAGEALGAKALVIFATNCLKKKKKRKRGEGVELKKEEKQTFILA